VRIAVVGAGIFGTTIALHLDAAGFDVELFEKHGRILSAASGINQYRIHRGYHYPRSFETSRYLRNAVGRFLDEYREAVFEGERHLYGIASTGSLTSAQEFVEFMERHDLEYRIVDDDRVEASRVALLVEAHERLLDPHVLAATLGGRLERSHVEVRLQELATERSTSDFDRVVLCGYASAASFFDRDPGLGQVCQFELCEKPVVRMPKDFGRPSIVILDGPFMCIDPVGTSDYFVMGNVVHAIHATNVGLHPAIPERFVSLLDDGVVPAPAFSRFSAFVSAGRRFIPAIARAQQVGSMFTVRTVLPGLEQTDARPTIVRMIDERTISVFSGKLATCVDAADRVTRLLGA
jgi:hypothetical protein